MKHILELLKALFSYNDGYKVRSGQSERYHPHTQVFSFYSDARKYYESCTDHYVELVAIEGKNGEGLIDRRGWGV